ncbi:putative transcription factor interactor and regulator CCHC(Zn) family [Arabidopsis thaliana]
MTDIGEKGRPPGDPPDGRGSWVAKVTGTSVGGRPNPASVLDEEFVSARMRVEFPNGEDGEPVITIEQEVLDVMNSLWKQCMIVKVLGRNIPIAVLSRKLKELWRPNGAMTVMDLPRQFFMVRFEKEEEYFSALTGGPWRAFGSYLMVRAWSPEFEPMKDEIVTTPVWVRLSNIPLNLYDKSILMKLATGLGKPLKVDEMTLNYERARFARVCVEINLRRPLKGSVVINGERYFVSYEGLTNICSHCGIYGHLVHTCPNGAPVQAGQTQKQNVSEKTNGGVQENDGFTTVGRSGRRPGPPAKQGKVAVSTSDGDLGRNLREIPRLSENGNITLSNSFGRLQEDLRATKTREEVVMREANKENENIEEVLKNGKQILSANKGIFEREAVKGRNLNKGGGGRDRRIGHLKTKAAAGPKQLFKQNRPTRGLVYGPSSIEVELTNSGKRLRTERAEW